MTLTSFTVKKAAADFATDSPQFGNRMFCSPMAERSKGCMVESDTLHP